MCVANVTESVVWCVGYTSLVWISKRTETVRLLRILGDTETREVVSNNGTLEMCQPQITVEL